MTAREFLINISIILTVMALGALLETAVPMFLAKPWKQGRRAANLGLTALSFLSNWLLASIAAAAAMTLRPAGLLAQAGWPMWAEIVTGILVLDFSVGYLSHRAMHMWPPMWRFHQIHHSDPFVDVTTTCGRIRWNSVAIPVRDRAVWALGLRRRPLSFSSSCRPPTASSTRQRSPVGPAGSCPVALLGHAEHAQDPSLAGGIRSELQLCQPRDSLRPSSWHLYTGRTSARRVVWPRRCGSARSSVALRAAVDAISRASTTRRT